LIDNIEPELLCQCVTLQLSINLSRRNCPDPSWLRQY